VKVSLEINQHLESAVTNGTDIHSKTKSRFESGNSCFYSIKNLLSCLLPCMSTLLYRVAQKERSIVWEVIVSDNLSKLYTHMCLIPNGFRDRAISLYSSKIVDKKAILRAVSNAGIYSSSDKVGTVYLAYIIENSIVNISALCTSCEDTACCSSECI
jgi:hypothetical protein